MIATGIGHRPGRPATTASCPLCSGPIRYDGIWLPHVLVERKPPTGPTHIAIHIGCLHPEVIVVTDPFDGKTSENVEVGRLKGASSNSDFFWLELDDIVASKKNAIRAYAVSIPWPRVRKIELRYAR